MGREAVKDGRSILIELGELKQVIEGAILDKTLRASDQHHYSPFS